MRTLNPLPSMLVHLQLHILVTLLLAIGFTVPTFAATDSGPQEFGFVFRMAKDKPLTTRDQPASVKFEYRASAPTYEVAFKQAAQACFRHFKADRRLSEDEGLDIIDTCANPRGS